MDRGEPMDIDGYYEDKENSIHHSNVLSRTPCTEKGYEELDISELNMKLRYSITPASSPMTRSITSNSKDHKNISVASDNTCLTSSLNSTLTNNDSYNNVCPLKTLPTDHLNDTNRNVLVSRSLDNGDNNITITISDNADENFSIPSTSSSIPHTPEATTPTKELPKDGGSPIMRGLRSVFSMFRPSQSPIAPYEHTSKENDDGPGLSSQPMINDAQLHALEVSTLVNKTNRSSPKRSSPLKESLVFNDDLEKELQWEDESSVLFKGDKIPKRKLLLPETVVSNLESKLLCESKAHNKTLEYMDISYNDTILKDKTMTDIEIKANIEANALESDSEFVDCETNYNKVEIASPEETKEKELKSKEKNAGYGNTTIQNSCYVDDSDSLNMTVPAECLNISHNKVEENNSVLNKNVNKETFNVTNDNNSCRINSNTLTGKEEGHKVLTLTEVVANSNSYLSNSKEKELSAELKLNASHKIDQNSAIQNSSMVENNYSFNATVSIGTLDTSHNRVEQNNVVLNKQTCHVNNDNNNSKVLSDSSHDFKNNTLTFTEEKALTSSEARDNFNLYLSDRKDTTEQTILQSNITSTEFDTNLEEELKFTHNCTTNNVLNIVDNSFLPENTEIQNIQHSTFEKRECEEIKVSQTLDVTKAELNNTFAICVNIEKEQSGIPTKVDESTNAEISVDNVNILTSNGTKEQKTFTEVVDDDKSNRDYIDKEECDEVNYITTLDVAKVDKNLIASVYDGLVHNAKDSYNSNSTKVEVSNKLDQFELDPEVLDADICSSNQTLATNKSVSNRSHNLSRTDDNSQIEILNAETTDLLGNHSNMTYFTSHEQETKDSMLYNENRYFQISIDAEIPELKFMENTIKENKIDEGFQYLAHNISCQKSLNLSPTGTCQDNNVCDQNSGCKDTSHEGSKKLNDLETTYVRDNCVDSQIAELPAHIPLPSDSEAEENNVESYLETNQVDYLNDKTSIEVMLNTNPIKTDFVIDSIGKVNNPDFKSIGDTEIKESLDSPNALKTNNAFEDKNEANTNKCIIENKEKNNTGIITNNLVDDINQDKNEITSHTEQLPSSSIIPNSEVHQHTRTVTIQDIIPLENSNSNNLESNMKDFGDTSLKEVSNPFETKNNLRITPPLSPLLSEKGYDINFDNIDDPFATKTKIRQSPTPESPSNVLTSPMQDNYSRKNIVKPKRNTPKNKGKSQHLRKSGNTENNVLNATYVNNSSTNDLEKPDIKAENLKTSTPNSDDLSNSKSATFEKFDLEKENHDENISKSIKTKHIKISLDFTEPSSDKILTKSVFNCPEINDVNFRSSSNIQNQTLLHSETSISNLCTDNKQSFEIYLQTPKPDGIESVQSEVKHVKEQTPNIDNDTFVSQNTNSDITREVNTEDEDTATFIEMEEELIEHKNLETQEKHMTALQIPDTATDNENIDNGEIFIDAETYEFLLNQNKTNIIAESGKESLFLKFDPLFAKRVSSDGIIAALKKVQNKQSTPKKICEFQLVDVPNLAGPSKLENTFDDGNDEASVQAMSKPMMVVNPAVNPIVSPRKVITPKINRQSLTFTSPAMAVIDRLLSLSGNHSDTDQNLSIPSRQANETDIAITQLREMLADKDIHVHNLRSESKDLKDRLSSLETQVKTLEIESADKLRKINDLSETLVEKTKMNKSMAIVVEEYEKTIASLVTQMEQEKKSNSEERTMLIKERDEQTAHLESMEVSFSDLHSKYEKSKQIIYSMKANEDTLRKSIKEFEESLGKMQSNYELLKQHATSKLNHANQELEKFNRAHESEILKLKALIKRKELHITSLEETLAQKTKANEELTAICDELINKVG